MENFENNARKPLNADDDEIIYVSKSEIKRDAEALKKIGVELIKLSKNELDKIPLDDDLRAAIDLAQKIKKEGYRRQIQLIGKMMRSRDMDPINQGLDKLKNKHNQQVSVFHKLERLRDNLIETGDSQEIINLYPTADRQHLRALARAAKKDHEANKPGKSFRLIFQYLKELSEKKYSL